MLAYCCMASTLANKHDHAGTAHGQLILSILTPCQVQQPYNGTPACSGWEQPCLHSPIPAVSRGHDDPCPMQANQELTAYA